MKNDDLDEKYKEDDRLSESELLKSGVEGGGSSIRNPNGCIKQTLRYISAFSGKTLRLSVYIWRSIIYHCV